MERLGPLTWHAAATVWVWRPLVLAAVALLAVGYLRAVSELGRRGERWPRGRTTTFLAAGLGSVVLTTSSWLGGYAPRLFWVYSLQLALLLTVVPVLLALGRPLALLRASFPDGRFEHGLGGRWWRIATAPLVAALLVPVAMSVVVFTPVMAASLRSTVTGQLVTLGLLLVGLVVAVPLVDEVGTATSLALAAAVLLGIGELILDALPGIVVRLSTHILGASHWATIARPWGPSPLTDQQHGGAVLWFLGDAIDIPFLALLFRRWIRADAEEAHAVDRALDAADDGTGMMRPWWLSAPASQADGSALDPGARADG